MTKPYVTHARSMLSEGRGLCGTGTTTFADLPTCQRCRSIMSGQRRVETQQQRILRFEQERREFGRVYCACNGQHPEAENHGPIRCF